MTYQTKNQSFVKEGIANDCTVYSISAILELTYGVILPYSTVEGLVSNAFINKVLRLTGATFSVIYPWVANKISDTLNLSVVVKKSYIPTSGFERLVDSGSYFGIGLVWGNSRYGKATLKGYLTKEDMDNIKAGEKKWGHNNVYGLSQDGKGTSIYEVARGKEVKCPLEVLRYGVEIGVFRSPARTLVGGNPYSKLVVNYLQQINHRRLVNKPEFTSTHNEFERNALNHANELNKKYVIQTKGK